MATYNTAFGSLPGYNEQMGTTNTTGGGQQQTYNPEQGRRRRMRDQYMQGEQGGFAPQQTFAQMQQQGQARPAPQEGGWFGGGQQAGVSTAQQPTGVSNQFQQQLQRQLQGFMAQPSAYNTQAFQQIRGAQAANLQAEYGAEQKKLDEELAKRGLYSSSIGGGMMGDLAGQQARALSSLDAQLLQQFATTQAADRLAAMRAAQEYATQQQTQALKGAELTGTYGGQQTLAAQQAANQKALQEAALTGVYGGNKTLAAQEQATAREMAIAGLTGQYGGQQTQSAKQFDVEQALREKLGLGNLTLEQQKAAAQKEQFAQTQKQSSEQFYAQMQQQQQDAAAERTLREKLQTGQLTSQETQQLRDIDARKALQTQQINEQARQFGIQMDEQTNARIQQGGFTTEELAIKRQQVDNELATQNRQMTETERNNLAMNSLEQDKLDADKDFRSQQLGLNRDELNQRAAQIVEDQRLRGVEIDNEQAYRTAEIDARTTQIQNEYTIAGKQIDVDNARIIAQKDIASADNIAQMARLVKQTGSQETIAGMDTALRRQLGLMEATGNVYDAAGNVVQGTGGAATQTLASRLKEAGITGKYGGTLTQDALQNAYAQAAQLSQLTGKQWSVNSTTGEITQGTADTLAGKQFTSAKDQQAYEQALGRAQQLAQTTGYQYEPKRNPNTNEWEASPITGDGGAQKVNIPVQQLLGTILGQQTVEAKTAQTQQDLARQNMFMQILGILSPALGNTSLADALTKAGQSGMSSNYVYDPATDTYINKNAKK